MFESIILALFAFFGEVSKDFDRRVRVNLQQMAACQTQSQQSAVIFTYSK